MFKINSYSHIAFHVKDMEAMLDFYCNKLGMKQKFTMTTDTLLEFSEYQSQKGIETPKEAQGHLDFARMNPGLELITYVEMAPRQFLEFFHIRQAMEEPGELSNKYGYQHLAIEVEDIHATWAAVTEKGIIPDSEINMGPDFTYQFWIHDPDGNRIEFMEYTDLSLQTR